MVADPGQAGRPLPDADRVSAGFPGMVREGVVLSAPHFVTESGPGSKVDPALEQGLVPTSTWPARWPRRSGKPTKVANDADVQGAAVVAGKGLELVITLGTGFGTAALPGRRSCCPHLEIAHQPFRKGETYNEQLGERTRKDDRRRAVEPAGSQGHRASSTRCSSSTTSTSAAATPAGSTATSSATCSRRRRWSTTTPAFSAGSGCGRATTWPCESGQRQPHVVLGDGAPHRLGGGHVALPGPLDPRRRTGRRREAGGAARSWWWRSPGPATPSRGTGPSSRRGRRARPRWKKSASARASTADVRDGEVHALGPGRRDDVGGVAGQEQVVVLHGLADVAAHRGDALLDDRALVAGTSPRRPGGAAAPPRCGRRASWRCRRPGRPGGRGGTAPVSAGCAARSRAGGTRR